MLTNLSGVVTRANRRVGLEGFVAPALDDFRLRADSPAVGRVDLGAHELP